MFGVERSWGGSGNLVEEGPARKQVRLNLRCLKAMERMSTLRKETAVNLTGSVDCKPEPEVNRCLVVWKEGLVVLD